MICPYCLKEGRLSTMRPTSGITTAVSRPDVFGRDGVLTMYHAANTRTGIHECSNGHRFELSTAATHIE